jgi:hypothetical protein
MCLLRIFSTKTRQTNAPTPSQVRMRSESNLAWCRIFTFEKSDVRTKFLLSIFENHIPVQNTIKQSHPRLNCIFGSNILSWYFEYAHQVEWVLWICAHSIHCFLFSELVQNFKTNHGEKWKLINGICLQVLAELEWIFIIFLGTSARHEG